MGRTAFPRLEKLHVQSYFRLNLENLKNACNLKMFWENHEKPSKIDVWNLFMIVLSGLEQNIFFFGQRKMFHLHILRINNFLCWVRMPAS